jgi:hypothetical protein
MATASTPDKSHDTYTALLGNNSGSDRNNRFSLGDACCHKYPVIGDGSASIY